MDTSDGTLTTLATSMSIDQPVNVNELKEDNNNNNHHHHHQKEEISVDSSSNVVDQFKSKWSLLQEQVNHVMPFINVWFCVVNCCN